MPRRGPTLSKGEPIFKDRKSAIITISVVAALIIFAVVAIDRTSVNRFNKLFRQAHSYQEEALQAIQARFDFTKTVAKILDEEGVAHELTPLVVGEFTAFSTSEISERYVAIDTELAALQRAYYEKPFYKRLAPYYEEIYRCELELIDALSEYNHYAEYFNADIKAFPGILTARRLELVAFSFFDFGSALKSRP